MNPDITQMPRRCSASIRSRYSATRFCRLCASSSDASPNDSIPKKMPMHPEARIRSSSGASFAMSMLA
jgi:hypothetical protein